MATTQLNIEDESPSYSGQDVIYRERGVTMLDVQRAADMLLRLGQKPSIAALREQMGGGSPNTIGPLLEKYWKSLGTRIQSGPEAFDRVPESLARLTEALWLRAIDEARQRVKGSTSDKTPEYQTFQALETKVTELTAALAESRARESQTEAHLVTSLRDRVQLRDQLDHLTALLKAEQELRAQGHGKTDSQQRELEERRSEIREFAARRLATRSPRKSTGSLVRSKGKRNILKRSTSKSLRARVAKPKKGVNSGLEKRGKRRSKHETT